MRTLDYFNLLDSNYNEFISVYNKLEDELNDIEKAIKTGEFKSNYKNFSINELIILSVNNTEVRVEVKLGGYNPAKYPNIERIKAQVDKIRSKYFPINK